MTTSRKPNEVLLALRVISSLEANGAENIDALRKALPIYAMKLSKSGRDVTVETLRDSAEKGMKFLADEIKRLSAQAAGPRQSRSYESIVAGLARSGDLSSPNPEDEAVEKFWKDCIAGDLRAVKSYVKAIRYPSWGSDHYCMQAMRVAAYHAKLNVFRYLHEEGYGDIHMNHDEPLRYAAHQGNLAMVKYIYRHSSEQPEYEEYALNWAVAKDCISVVRYLHKEHGVPFIKGDIDSLHTAISNGALKSIKYMHKNGVDLRANNDQFLMEAAAAPSVDVFSYLHKLGADIHANEDDALFRAVLAGNVDIVEYLHEHGVDVAQCNSRALFYALQYGDRDMIACLEDMGLTRLDFKGDMDAALYRSDKWFSLSKKHDISEQLWLHNPHYFKPELFHQIKQDIWEHEKVTGPGVERVSFAVSALFGHRNNMLLYFEKWGKYTKKPLFDLLDGIEIPKDGCPDFKSWGDAVIQHGPKMAELVKYADKCPVPLRSACGRTYSYEATRDAIALERYDQAKIFPDMAKFCFKRNWASEHFNKAASLVEQYQIYYGVDAPKRGGFIPEVKVDGKRFEKEGYHFYKLPDGDPRGLLLGEYTDNCQHIAGVGAACAEYGFLFPNSGFYVVAHKETDEIIAQSWAWRGENGEMVFDSLEGLGGRMQARNWGLLIKSLKYQFRKHADISAFYIGDGGHTPHVRMIDLKALPAKDHAVPPEYGKDAYRDSNETQLRVFKRRYMSASSLSKFNMHGQ